MKETEPGFARQVEEHWVSEGKQLSEDQKKSLKIVRAIFFENPNYRNEEPEFVVSQLTGGQIKNVHEGAMAILSADREEVLNTLGNDQDGWNRYFSAALEINKKFDELSPEQSETKAA